MTDHSEDQADTNAPETSTENAAVAAYANAKEKLSSAERTIAFGALLLLIGVYLIADVALDEWAIGQVTWSACVGALALMYWTKVKGQTVPIPYVFSLKVLSYLVGALGVTEVLWFVDGGRAEGIEFLFVLAYFVGVVAMVLGARQLTD